MGDIKVREKKFRGRRRYYRNLYKRMRSFKVPNSSWFDFWHYHVDWYGLSKESFRSKIQHEEALMILLNNIDRQMKERGITCQVWGQISSESESNAIYINTPNPNIGTNAYSKFPYDFPNTTWTDFDKYTFGTMTWGKNSILIVRVK